MHLIKCLFRLQQICQLSAASGRQCQLETWARHKGKLLFRRADTAAATSAHGENTSHAPWQRKYVAIRIRQENGETRAPGQTIEVFPDDVWPCSQPEMPACHEVFRGFPGVSHPEDLGWGPLAHAAISGKTFHSLLPA